MNEYIVKEHGKRLDAYIATQNMDLTRTAVQRLIEEGNILVNGKKQKVSYKVSIGDIITIEEVKPQEIELKAQEIPMTDAEGNVLKKANGEDRTVSYWQLIALKGAPQLEGDVITSATTEFDNLQGNIISMRMNDKGSNIWANVTGANLGRAIAIVLDNHAYSYPRVNSKIEGGSSQITGDFTPEEANDLANVLKSGRMSAQVNVVSNNVIGPSLGAEAVEQGMLSFVVALVLLMIFMS